MLETAAVVVTLLNVVLTIRQNIWCWPVGIVSVALYAIVSFQVKLYAGMGLQGMYGLFSFYGWWMWLQGGAGKSRLPVTHAGWTTRAALIMSGATGALLLGFFLDRSTDAAAPYADSFLTSFSLVAQWLLTRKQIESWIVWIVVDIGYVILYMVKQLHLTALLYAFFIVLAGAGYLEWKRDLTDPPPA